MDRHDGRDWISAGFRHVRQFAYVFDFVAIAGLGVGDRADGGGDIGDDSVFGFECWAGPLGDR
jgi:hypothetical protein